MRLSTRRLGLIGMSLTTAGTYALLLSAGPRQESQPEPQAEAPAQEVALTSELIATYDPRLMFQQSERSARLNEKILEMKNLMEMAHLQGDQQRFAELQAQAQQLHASEVNSYLAQVRGVLPEVAKETGVKIIAINYSYLDPSLGTPVDLTTAIGAKIE